MRRSFFVFSSLLVLMSLPTLALATTVTLFEKVYLKPVGKPVTHSDTFSLGPNTGNYQLVVRNGVDGSSEVQNVFVWVNGVQAFGHRDFKKADTAAAEVELGATNTITVALQGQGNTFVTVEIIGEQAPTEPPPFDPGKVVFW